MADMAKEVEIDLENENVPKIVAIAPANDEFTNARINSNVTPPPLGGKNPLAQMPTVMPLNDSHNAKKQTPQKEPIKKLISLDSPVSSSNEPCRVNPRHVSDGRPVTVDDLSDAASSVSFNP